MLKVSSANTSVLAPCLTNDECSKIEIIALCLQQYAQVDAIMVDPVQHLVLVHAVQDG